MYILQTKENKFKTDAVKNGNDGNSPNHQILYIGSPVDKVHTSDKIIATQTVLNVKYAQSICIHTI